MLDMHNRTFMRLQQINDVNDILASHEKVHYCSALKDNIRRRDTINLRTFCYDSKYRMSVEEPNNPRSCQNRQSKPANVNVKNGPQVTVLGCNVTVGNPVTYAKVKQIK